jgi:deoxyadenosine/deoxycytidine kinase
MSAAVSDGPGWQDVWSPPPAITKTSSHPNYIAVIGNSGSGKSTLVTRLANELFTDRVIAIDERTTHHPFLDRLFYDPVGYSFELQVNFMLQRVLIARRWLDAGVHVVMERSHHDDPIFIEHLFGAGLVNAVERDVYLQLWEALDARTPVPDCLIGLSVPSQESVRRITADEQAGRRPREFPSEDAKTRWLDSWAQLYEARFDALRNSPRTATRFRTFTPDDGYDAVRDFALSRLTDTAGKDI